MYICICILFVLQHDAVVQGLLVRVDNKRNHAVHAGVCDKLAAAPAFKTELRTMLGTIYRTLYECIISTSDAT